MSEHEEFDKYIKGLFDESPQAPSELSWDKMDIELPQKKKRKKYGWIFFLAGVALFGMISAFYVRSYDASANFVQIKDTQEIEPTLSSSHQNVPTTSQEVQNVGIAKNEDVLSEDPGKRGGSDAVLFDGASNVESQLQTGYNVNAANRLVANPLEQTASFSESNSQKNQSLISSTTSVDNVLDSFKEDEQNQVINTLDYPMLSESRLGESMIFQDQLAKSTEYIAIVQLSKLPITLFKQQPTSSYPLTLSLEDLKSDEQNDKNKFKVEGVILGYGGNHLNLAIDASNVLSGKVDREFGNSIHGGISFRISDDWRATTLIQYDQYHSTFNYTRDLDPEIDLQSFRRVNRKEVTFHNNYTNTLAVQLGLERKWPVFKKLEFSVGLNIAPTFVLSTSGKTTEGAEVNELTFDQEGKRLLLGAGLRTGIAIPIDPKFNVGLYYQHNRFFGNGVFVNSDVYATRQNGLGVMVFYKL